MHTLQDMPSLSMSYAMARHHGHRDEGIAIATEMILVEEMQQSSFIRLALTRVLEQDIGDQLVAAFNAGNMAGFGAELARLFEDEARSIADTYARAAN